MSHEPIIRKIRIRNFKSIQDETVEFANPLFLVGRNGSGKSNFLEALEFVADCMRSLQTAYDNARSIFNAFGLPRTSNTARVHSKPIEFLVEFEIQDDRVKGSYAFALSRRPDLFGVSVSRERCSIITGDNQPIWFDRSLERLTTNVEGIRFLPDPDALALPIIGGIAEFALVLKTLSSMRLYEISPSKMRLPQPLTDGFLKQDGSNTASILYRDFKSGGEYNELLQSLIQAVLPVPTIARTRLRSDEEKKNIAVSISFAQRLHKSDRTVAFRPSNMSDGTLRTLGMIAAVMQKPIPLVVAVEEPELHLHPGALGVISDLIEIGADRTQVIVATHSPELLDAKWIRPKNLRIVEWTDEGTRILPLGERPVRALQEHLMTTGELLRSNALDSAPAIREGMGENTSIFDEVIA